MILKLSQRLLGPVTLVLLALTVWLGLWVTPRTKFKEIWFVCSIFTRESLGLRSTSPSGPR